MKVELLGQFLTGHSLLGSGCARSHFPWQCGAEKADHLVTRPATPWPWQRQSRFFLRASDSHLTQIRSPNKEKIKNKYIEKWSRHLWNYTSNLTCVSWEMTSHLLLARWRPALSCTLWMLLALRILHNTWNK